MKFSYQLILFLIVNFGALAIGSWLMGGESQGEWYKSLNKAPWTPPGWVFGAAWTIVMITFSIFMAKTTEGKAIWNVNSALIGLFWAQWILNIAWNYIFFNQKWVGFGLAEITVLFAAILIITYLGARSHGLTALWALPYLIWLMIAISLNGYIMLRN